MPGTSQPFSLARVTNGCLPQVEGLTSHDLRLSVVAEMGADWPRYSEFVEKGLRREYLANMALTTTYAGEAELVAIAALHGVAIHVWGADQAYDRPIAAPIGAAGAPTVHVAHRHTGTFTDHYWGVSFLRHEVRSPSVPPMLASVRRVRVASPFFHSLRHRSVRSHWRCVCGAGCGTRARGRGARAGGSPLAWRACRATRARVTRRPS